MGIKKIEALISGPDVQAVEEALEALGIDSASITPAVSHRQGSTLYYRGAPYKPDWHRFKLECLVTDQLVPSAVETITRIASPCAPGDGMICIFEVADVSLLRKW